MGENSKIEWTDHTWNPWVGCSKVSIGCENCYMFREQERFGNDPTEIRRTKKRTFKLPNRIKEPSRIFVCSWSDFFHPDIPNQWFLEAQEIMYLNPQHTFLILTKRPENIKEMIPNDWWEICPNVWLGATAENQEMADIRIPLLLEIPAKVKFISIEPMIGEVNLWGNGSGLVGSPKWNGKLTFIEELDWVIVGGESGPGCRNINPDWARSIRDQCIKAGPVYFFMKQMSGNTKALREAIPEDLLIREFPE